LYAFTFDFRIKQDVYIYQSVNLLTVKLQSVSCLRHSGD